MSETITIAGEGVLISSITIPWVLNILLDISASMDDDAKLEKAKEGISTFLLNIAANR